MEINDKQDPKFEITDSFKKRALEVLDESQAKQFAEGMRLNSAIASVFGREYARIERKYGKDHPRTQEMKLRVEASAAANTTLYARYTEAATPIVKTETGWAVDGFVRTEDGGPVAGVTVAAYDKQNRWHRELGYSCTDEKGYFKMIAEKIPDKEMRVYMLASKGEKILKSNENRLTPAVGTTNRIEVIIERDGKDDCMPPSVGKDEPKPPQTEPGKDRPIKDVKDVKGAVPAQPAKGFKDKGPSQSAMNAKGKGVAGSSMANISEKFPKTKGASGVSKRPANKRGKK